MVSWKRIIVFASLIIINVNFVLAAAWKVNANAVGISGGENHTLVLTSNKCAWACGPNGGPGYSGVLGTGSASSALIEKYLVRIHDGDMNTPSDYLEDISDIDAGWKHSLALDVNGYVWAWGDNEEGELGVGEGTSASSTPVQVLRGEQAAADPNDPNLARIVDISAGRSGEHSLAVDANGYAYAWGYNKYGQCGNEVSGDGERELVPAHVRQGQQPDDPCDPNNWLKHIIAVSAAQTHSMALEAIDPCDPNWDGEVYTFGSNKWPVDGGSYPSGSGKLGDGTTVEYSDTPVRVKCGEQDYGDPNQVYLKHILAISAGWDHSMALEKYEPYDDYLAYSDPCYIWPDPNHRGRVYSWGNNGQGWGDDGGQNKSNGGRLGNGSATDGNSTPVLVLRGQEGAKRPGFGRIFLELGNGNLL